LQTILQLADFLQQTHADCVNRPIGRRRGKRLQLEPGSETRRHVVGKVRPTQAGVGVLNFNNLPALSVKVTDGWVGTVDNNHAKTLSAQ